MKSATIGEIIQKLDTMAPQIGAEDWDNVGLIAGDPNWSTTGAVLSIDLSEEAIEMAIQKKYRLIVNHHPCIFPVKRGLSKILPNHLIFHALKNGIAVAAYHTNFDQYSLEVVKTVSSGLGVTPQGRFSENLNEEVSKNLIRGEGYGFWGEFPSPRPFSDVAKDVKSLFNIHGFWITNPAPSQVSRVGFVAGKGASFVEAAASLQCDLFITGEAGYHTALSGLRRGVAVMELGHRESEKFFTETVRDWLADLGIGFVEAHTPTQKIWLGGTK